MTSDLPRIVDPRDLGLSPLHLMALAVHVSEEILAASEQGARIPKGLAYAVEAGLLEVYVRDELEAELGVGGSLLLEVRMPE